jgi:hypothetical protein
MPVKENQPQLLEDIATVFVLAPIAGERRTAAETLDLGHGRIEQRRLQTSNVLVGYSDWPGLAQVFQLERQVISKKTGEVREDVVAGVTSLAPERTDAARLLTLIRGQWQIESAPQAHGKEARDERTNCAEAAREMKGGPSKSASRSGLHTTPSGCGHAPWS